MAQRWRERRARRSSARRSARRWACAGEALAAACGLSDNSVLAGMALIQATAYIPRRRMQRITLSGTSPSTGSPAGEPVTDLRTRDRHLRAVDPGGAPARRDLGGDLARAGHDGQGDQVAKVVMAVPGLELGDQVCAHDQVELHVPAADARRGQDLLGGVHRVAGAAAVDLEPAGLGARDLPRQGLGQGVAVLGRGDRPLPAFCHGSLATTRSRRSSPRRSTTARAAATWPRCGGSNVPPRIPIRAGGSGPGKFCNDRRQHVHLRLVHDDVAESELLAPRTQDVDDLGHRADERGGRGRSCPGVRLSTGASDATTSGAFGTTCTATVQHWSSRSAARSPAASRTQRTRSAYFSTTASAATSGPMAPAARLGTMLTMSASRPASSRMRRLPPPITSGGPPGVSGAGPPTASVTW